MDLLETPHRPVVHPTLWHPRRRHLVCPAPAAFPAVVLLTEHLPAQHAALPIRRTAPRRAALYSGRLPRLGEGARDARGICPVAPSLSAVTSTAPLEWAVTRPSALTEAIAEFEDV